MKLSSQVHATGLLLVAEGQRIDAAAAIQFKDEVRRLSDGGPNRVVLDLGSVDFIDSSGLGAIVGAMKLLAPKRQLELAAPSENVRKVFRLTRMDTVFRIHASVADALGGLEHAS